MAEMTSIDVGTGPHRLRDGLRDRPDPNNAPAFAHGDAWFNHKYYNNPSLGSFAFAAGIMHEIGHTLGLKHGHVARRRAERKRCLRLHIPALSANHDSLEYSVMTYRSLSRRRQDTRQCEVNFRPLRCRTISRRCNICMERISTITPATRSTHSAPKTGAMSIDGVSQGATFHHKIFLTMWDGGGNDTYDFSNYKTNEVIDLNPGAWSTPSQSAARRSRPIPSRTPYGARLHRQRVAALRRSAWVYRECHWRQRQRQDLRQCCLQRTSGGRRQRQDPWRRQRGCSCRREGS